MTTTDQIKFEHLGQTGVKIDLHSLTVLVDPYLSHSVQELDAPDLVRQVPIPYQPGDLTDIDWVLITHEHMDHCDPHTIPIVAEVNPQCRFMGPRAVREQLRQWGIKENRVFCPPDADIDLGNSLLVRSVAAAHPTIRRDQHGSPQAVGFYLLIKSVCCMQLEIHQFAMKWLKFSNNCLKLMLHYYQSTKIIILDDVEASSVT